MNLAFTSLYLWEIYGISCKSFAKNNERKNSRFPRWTKLFDGGLDLAHKPTFACVNIWHLKKGIDWIKSAQCGHLSSFHGTLSIIRSLKSEAA